MKKILIILLFTCTPLQAEKIEQLSWFNLQEILEDDKLTYKIIKSCVSLNSAVTELIKKEHPKLLLSSKNDYPLDLLPAQSTGREKRKKKKQKKLNFQRSKYLSSLSHRQKAILLYKHK